MRRAHLFICLGASCCAPGMVQAQATSNAITGANDAFGFRKGDEAVGIYDEASARGFSLESAGNYRVHGTYFVKNSGVSSFFLDSISVRIGYNTLGVTLPSPSGVVDYALRDPAKGEPSLATVGLDAFLQPYADVLIKHRSEKVPASAALGVSFAPQMRDMQGGSGGGAVLIGGAARYSPGPADIRVFGGEYRYERPSQFRLKTEAALLDLGMDRGRFIGVKGMNELGQRRIGGLLADVGIGKNFGIGTTTVFSQEDPSKSFLTLFGGLADDGTVAATVIATPAQRTTSFSTEARAYWSNQEGDGDAHRVDAILRLRRTHSSFGGAALFDLGRVPFDTPLHRDGGEFLPNGRAELDDQIRQVGVGLAYRAKLGGLRLNAGMLRTSYRKSVTGPDIDESRLATAAWLYNLSAAYKLSRTIEIYAGHSRGLEEAGIAPASSPNRFEVLPPASARQFEAAVIFRPTAGFQLVVGAFDLQRGYFGADTIDGAYRQLGRVRHRGLEFSAAGTVAKGFSVVLGGVLIDPIVKTNGEHDLSFRPVGVPNVRLLASADYLLTGNLHVDAAVNFSSSRKAAVLVHAPDPAVPSSTTVNVGLRSPLRFGKVASTVRLQLLNLLNDFSWDVTSAGTMTYSPSRRFRLALTTEF